MKARSNFFLKTCGIGAVLAGCGVAAEWLWGLYSGGYFLGIVAGIAFVFLVAIGVGFLASHSNRDSLRKSFGYVGAIVLGAILGFILVAMIRPMLPGLMH